MLKTDALGGLKPARNECATCWYLKQIPDADAAVLREWLAGSYSPGEIQRQLAGDPDCASFPLPPRQSIQRHRLNHHGSQA